MKHTCHLISASLLCVDVICSVVLTLLAFLFYGFILFLVFEFVSREN